MTESVDVLLTEHQIDGGNHFEGRGELIWTVPNAATLAKTIQSVTAYSLEANLKLGPAGTSMAKIQLGFYDEMKFNFAPQLQIVEKNQHVQPFNLSVCVGLLLSNGDEVEHKRQMINTAVAGDEVLRFPNVQLAIGCCESAWSGYLTDSKACAFKVNFTLSYENICKSPKQILLEAAAKGLHQSLENSWINPELQDVSIICKGKKEIRANLFLLVARCPAIKTLFPGVVEKRSSEIHFPQIHRDVMEILLEFWYTAKLSDGWSAAGIVENFAFAVGLFRITELLEFLDKTLGQPDQVEGTMRLLKFAENFNLCVAKEKIIRNLVARAEVCKSSGELEALFCSCGGEEPKIKKQLPKKSV